MDLLGDIGATDQLTSTRAENKVLKERVSELEQRCKVLTVENEALKAEVEIYREEATLNKVSTGEEAPAGAGSSTSQHDHFVQCGNGVRVQSKEVLIENSHGMANPSCCSLSNDDTVLATGGADRNIALVQWGAALGGQNVMDKMIRLDCGAPVISVDFSRKPRSPFCAAGCMDGSVHVVHYETHSGLEAKEVAAGTIKHNRYVRTVAWWSEQNWLASGSADGSVQVHKVNWNGLDENIRLEKVETLNMPGTVEALCFHKGFLVCYTRDTPYLSYFDLNKNFEQTKRSLNQGPGNAGFDEHVSFAVMDITPHGDYLALATDTSRNIIVEFETGKQIRNLYGHQNDGFSQPKVAWSQNGQYLYGNTQDESALVVWDIASSSIEQRLEGHGNNIRDLFSSNLTDTVVTTSFDKKTHIWLPSAE